MRDVPFDYSILQDILNFFHIFSSCMGVVGCAWCFLDSDATTSLFRPFCSAQETCFGGVLGAATPYGDKKKEEEGN